MKIAYVTSMGKGMQKPPYGHGTTQVLQARADVCTPATSSWLEALSSLEDINGLLTSPLLGTRLHFNTF